MKEPTTQPHVEPVAPQVPPRQNGDDAPIALGITSLLIWVIMPLFGSIVGIILAAVGLNESKKQHGRGRGLNLAALITNICLTALQLLALILFIAFMMLGLFVSASTPEPSHDSESAPESSLKDTTQQHT